MLLLPRSVFLQLLVFTLTLTSLSAAPNSRLRYMLHHSPLPFEQAQEVCHPHSLASFTRAQELTQVLDAIAESPPAGSPTLWVGLRKAKNQCVVPSLPLRGFKWTQGGEDATETLWAHEPEHTCTSVLCAGLVAQLDGSMVTSWGLVPLSCKTRNPFICNLESDDGGLSGPELARTDPVKPKPAWPETAEPESARPGPKSVEPESARPEPAGPESVGTELSEQKPEIPEPPTLVPTVPESVGPESATPDPAVPELSELKPEIPEPPKPEPVGPDLVESTQPEPELKEPERRPDETGLDTGPESGSASCPHPVVAGARFLSLDPDNSSRIQVDCWSKVHLDLHCSGRAGVWRLPGGAPANLSTMCTPCGTGYRKDTSGDCVDVDECSGPHGCRHECVNTMGSFTCVCAEDGTVCDPTKSNTPGSFSGALVLGLVGAAVVLVVLE